MPCSKVERAMLQGSHVQEFGLLSIADEKASNFEGFHKVAVERMAEAGEGMSSGYVTLEQLDADLLYLRLEAAKHSKDAVPVMNPKTDVLRQGQQPGGHAGDILMASSGEAAGVDAERQLAAALAERARVDGAMQQALQLVLWDGLEHPVEQLAGT